MVRLSRAEQSEKNRAKILASARTHFEELGYYGASVDSIAEDAGFSKGAIYSQFGSKDDLMLAVLEASIDERQRDTDRFIDLLGDEGSIEDVLGQTWSASIRSQAWQAALTEFRIHAWRQPELADRYQALHRLTIDNIASTLPRMFKKFGLTDTEAFHDLAVAVLAMNSGLLIESFAVGDLDVVKFVRTITSLVGSGQPRPKGATT